jgi:hypothetical protein
MRFRPLIGYLILVGATVILSLSTIRLAMQQELGAVFFEGSVLGIVVGYFMFRHAWRFIQQLVTNRTQMNLQEGKELLGHRLYRWVFEGWMAYIIFVVLVLPVDVSDFILRLTTFISGALSGAIVIYFLSLAILTFEEERRLKRRIVITVE